MKLFWVDLETTGLSPQSDRILEIAVAEAELLDPFNVKLLYHEVLGMTADEIEALGRSNQYVYDMHMGTGLLPECNSPHVKSTVKSVEKYLLDVVPVVTDREDMPTLAGSTVHFDLGFLRVHMPTLAKRFSHRVYDVSAVKLFCRSLGMQKPPKAEAHRAKDDILESIDHAKICVDWLRDHHYSSPRSPR